MPNYSFILLFSQSTKIRFTFEFLLHLRLLLKLDFITVDDNYNLVIVDDLCNLCVPDNHTKLECLTSTMAVEVAPFYEDMKLHNRVVTRYVGSGIKGLKRDGIRDQLRDHSPGIWNHNAWDEDQQCFSWNQGSGIKILIVFGIRDQDFG